MRIAVHIMSFLIVGGGAASLGADTIHAAGAASRPAPPVVISGVMPRLAAVADIAPVNSEAGIGALMPWAGRLWFITYVAHLSKSGGGTGLFTVDADLLLHKHPASVVGTFANRMVHIETNQLIMGPHVIDAAGNVRTIEALCEHRLAATMEHLQDPRSRVCFLTMEGLVFEVDLRTLEARQLFDLTKELALPDGAQPHFKAAWTGGGRVVVANNTYDEKEYLGQREAGRLAEWDGKTWTILERSPFYEVFGRKGMGNVMFATGWDRASAVLKVFTHGRWFKYRLPKTSQAWDHLWQTEWPRIREVESERYLMDCQGMFYEFTPLAYGGHVWGVRPICTHLRNIPDFCSWRGLFVLGGNQVTPIWEGNRLAGQPQSGLWLGKTDDLWQFGKPKGWGGPWWETRIAADTPSDPYLMTGFDQKTLHLSHDAGRTVRFTIEVDFLGNGSWQRYDTIDVPARGYKHHEFPAAFGAHWVRITSDTACTASAHLIYG